LRIIKNVLWEVKIFFNPQKLICNTWNAYMRLLFADTEDTSY